MVFDFIDADESDVQEKHPKIDELSGIAKDEDGEIGSMSLGGDSVPKHGSHTTMKRVILY